MKANNYLIAGLVVLLLGSSFMSCKKSSGDDINPTPPPVTPGGSGTDTPGGTGPVTPGGDDNPVVPPAPDPDNPVDPTPVTPDPVVPETKKYTITFVSNVSTVKGSVPDPIVFEEGQTATIPDAGSLSRAGFMFLGWSTDPNADKASMQSGNTYSVQANAIFYPVWQSVDYQIVYHYDYEDPENTNIVDFSGSNFELEAPSISANIRNLPKEQFLMYWKDAQGNKYMPGNKITDCDNLELYPVLSQPSDMEPWTGGEIND